MKMRNKGNKVYPSPSSSSSSLPPSVAEDSSLSVLNFLPAAILALATILTLEDREVLAYMITRSIQSTNPSSSSSSRIGAEKGKKPTKTHKPPVFDCDCFDCYTSYWFKWDSSPNRELIHKAIEAFEEQYLNNGGEQLRRKNINRKQRTGRVGNSRVVPGRVEPEGVSAAVVSPEIQECAVEAVEDSEAGGSEDVAEVPQQMTEEAEDMVVRAAAEALTAANHHHHPKGLARKVLPDVLGLFNSRLWSLWSPNV